MTDQYVRMQYCDDGNGNFSNWKTQSTGEVGQYSKPIVFTRLGQFRHQRVFRIEVSSRRKRDLMGAVGVLEPSNG